MSFTLTPVGIGLFLINLVSFAVAPPPPAPASSGCGGASIVGSPSPGPVSNHLSGVVSLSPKDAWAVGAAASTVGNPPILQTKSLVAHWDGSAWRQVPTASLSGAGALSSITALSSQNIWAVGHQGPSDAGAPLVEHWDGKTWGVVPSPAIPVGYLLGVSALRSDDIWAVGIRLGTVSYTLIEHWDGSTWKVVASPNPGTDYNEMDSVVSLSSKSAWAVGFSVKSNASQPILARWDGSSWSVVAGPVTGAPNNILRSAAAVSERDVWAAGQSSSADGSKIQPLLEHWNGSGWKVVTSPSPTPQAWLTGITVASDGVWAVGVQVAGFTKRTLVEHAEEAGFTVVPSQNRGTGDNGLEAVASGANGSVWAVGSDQGQAKGESLILHACSAQTASTNG